MHLSATGNSLNFVTFSERFVNVLGSKDSRATSVFVLFISVHEEEFTETEIVNYFEERGFTICWHQRDFMPGTNIAENIADATENSRRMIFVISR